MSPNQTESDPSQVRVSESRAAAAVALEAGHTKAVASLILGILALALLLLVPIAGLVCGLVGLPLGLSSRRERRERNAMALAGWVMSLVAVGLELAILILLGIIIAL